MQTTAAQHAPVTEDQVYAAIADVLDPELDEPLVKLGFIDRVQVEEQDVTITFKLPTFWCAPNFAYLMAMDLRTRVHALPGVHTVRVLLLDHFADDEINMGINSGQSFSEAFPDEAPEDANLEHLRQTFLRKGFLMRQDNLLRQMLKAGLSSETITALRIADMHIDEAANSVTLTTSQGTVQLEKASQNASIYLRKGRYLGLLQTRQDQLIVDDAGQPIAAQGIQEHLRRSRSIRLNIMFNMSMCKGLFRTRYEDVEALEAHRDDK